MSQFALRLYWKVPALKNLGATYAGWQLQRKRYGRKYRETLQAILQRDDWSAEQLADYQNEQLRRLVAHAAAHIPYYRETFRERGLNVEDIRGLADLARLPILEKQLLREQPLQFVDERQDPVALNLVRTSGTTGTPLRIYNTTDTLQVNYAFMEARCRRPAGMQFGRRPYIMLGAQPVAPVTRTRPPFWCYNYVAKQLYMSVFHLSPRYLGAYCRELRRKPYHAIMGFPSCLYSLARYVLHNESHRFHFNCAITSGELLYPEQRRAIEEAFGCMVFDQYGCTENCVFAAQCAHGNMHLSVDYGIVEVVDAQGNHLPNGNIGDLVCTGFINQVQVLMRYRVGDRGALASEPCACGSPLPVLRSLEGRSGLDAFVTRDGRRITRVGEVIESIESVVECQVVQEDFDRYCVRVVLRRGFEPGDSERIRRNLAESVGKAEIDVISVDAIERTAGGKARFLVSHVQPASRELDAVP